MLEPRFRHLLNLTAHLEAPQLVGDTPLGGRKIVMVTGGTFEGDRMRGKVLPGGGDWALTRADGSLILDVRLVLESDDGERIFMTYRGVRHGPEAVMRRLAAGEPVEPTEYYFRILPLFETASDKYAWLNGIVCVGIGERLDVGPRYTIHEVL
jgi:hypothetical protein